MFHSNPHYEEFLSSSPPCALTGEGECVQCVLWCCVDIVHKTADCAYYLCGELSYSSTLFLKHWRNTTTMTSHRIGRHESGIERSCMRKSSGPHSILLYMCRYALECGCVVQYRC